MHNNLPFLHLRNMQHTHSIYDLKQLQRQGILSFPQFQVAHYCTQCMVYLFWGVLHKHNGNFFNTLLPLQTIIDEFGMRCIKRREGSSIYNTRLPPPPSHTFQWDIWEKGTAIYNIFVICNIHSTILEYMGRSLKVHAPSAVGY